MVRVRLFAALRERAGTGTVDVELSDEARVGDVWGALALGDEPPGILFAVNKAYAARDATLSAGDEVALIPPVSGGAGDNASGSEPQSGVGAHHRPDGGERERERERDNASGSEPQGPFRLVGGPLSLDAAVDEVRGDEAGAIATFTGTVRNRSRGRDVLHLEYEAYEDMAEEVMAELAARLRQQHGLTGIAIHHRVGRVEIGEASVVIATSAPHRAEALAACKAAIDTLKTSVPLWKKEVYDGGEEWIGQGS